MDRLAPEIKLIVEAIREDLRSLGLVEILSKKSLLYFPTHVLVFHVTQSGTMLSTKDLEGTS